MPHEISGVKYAAAGGGEKTGGLALMREPTGGSIVTFYFAGKMKGRKKT